MARNEYKAFMQHKVLESIYNKMDDSERLVFMLASLQNNNHREEMDALANLSKQVDNSKHSWLSDFGANIAGNAVFDGATWLLLTLLKHIRL